MRVPALTSLKQAFPSIAESQLNLVRLIGQAAAMPIRGQPDQLEQLVERLPQTARYVRSLHSDPYRSRIWRTTVALEAMNDIMGTYGVEPLGPPRSGDYAPPYEYLNTGDPYTTTLVYRRASDSLHIGNWGDIAERHPDW